VTVGLIVILEVQKKYITLLAWMPRIITFLTQHHSTDIEDNQPHQLQQATSPDLTTTKTLALTLHHQQPNSTSTSALKMLYAGYYNLSAPSSGPASRRGSEKSNTSTTSSTEQQLPQQPERRKSFLQKVIYQLKPIEQPVLVDGVWSPMFVSKAERQAAEAEAKARKGSVAAEKKQRGSISKAQYELISAAA
jgi:hypothetical protein